MASQKIENVLNLALDATQEERLRSGNLEVGYDEADNTWDVIILYSGTLDSVDLEALYATPEASLPYVKELYQETDDPALRAEIRNYWGGFGQYDVPFHEQNLEHFLAQENTI